jgi:hypothetical protein
MQNRLWTPFDTFMGLGALALLLALLLVCLRPSATAVTPPPTLISASSVAIAEPTPGTELTAGLFSLQGTATAGETVEIYENESSGQVLLGKVVADSDGKWTLEVPPVASEQRSFEALGAGKDKGTGATATYRFTASTVDTTCTEDFRFFQGLAEGSTISAPFRFGGLGTGKSYSVTVKRGGRQIGVKQIPLDSTCGWSYLSNPGLGAITYEVRETSADPASNPLQTLNLTVQ